LTQALEAGYQTGGAPISAELIEMLLSKQLDDPETTLTSHGYRLRDLVEQFDAIRTSELRDRMRAEGLPI
jgi:hypothetical protein